MHSGRITDFAGKQREPKSCRFLFNRPAHPPATFLVNRAAPNVNENAAPMRPAQPTIESTLGVIQAWTRVKKDEVEPQSPRRQTLTDEFSFCEHSPSAAARPSIPSPQQQFRSLESCELPRRTTNPWDAQWTERAVTGICSRIALDAPAACVTDIGTVPGRNGNFSCVPSR